jgi:hypothetical protein
MSEDTATTFIISEFVKDHYPDLITLLIGSESMDDEERQYWFTMLPDMTEMHVEKLREILINEKNRLSAINVRYESALKKLGDDKLGEWKEEKRKKRSHQRKLEENISEVKDTEDTEKLFDELNNIA